MIRVAFMHKLKRAKLANLVQLLTGRDFETREFKEEIIDDTFNKMYEGVLNVISQHNFTQFMIAIKSAGFISNKWLLQIWHWILPILFICCYKNQTCLLRKEKNSTEMVCLVCSDRPIQ